MPFSQLPDSPHGGRAAVVYTGMRFALFLGCLGIVVAIGFRGFAALLVALAASGLLSLFLLSRQRAAMSVAVDRRVNQLTERARARAAAEDAYVDSLHGDQAGITPADR
ncbi:MAG TPA: DUF4229 domain-containing protein [Mycobacteriales bacterium]|nr:DUF4229 domain-containing protein [Mycobacteriales bacterium]